MANLSYLGGAEKWPTELNNLGQITMTGEFDLIEQSIIRSLSCPVGTEFFNEDFGSRIEKVEYEPNDYVLQAMLDTIISETIEKHEKRVSYIRTEFYYDENDDVRVYCKIFVNVLSKNEIKSLIWPYSSENI
jgi:phage baseplate assembly protein W